MECALPRKETAEIKELMVGRSETFVESLTLELNKVETELKDHIDKHFTQVQKDVKTTFAAISTQLQKQDDALSDIKALVVETLGVALEQRFNKKIIVWFYIFLRRL